jgi:hypothetical protein
MSWSGSPNGNSRRDRPTADPSGTIPWRPHPPPRPSRADHSRDRPSPAHTPRVAIPQPPRVPPTIRRPRARMGPCPRDQSRTPAARWSPSPRATRRRRPTPRKKFDPPAGRLRKVVALFYTARQNFRTWPGRGGSRCGSVWAFCRQLCCFTTFFGRARGGRRLGGAAGVAPFHRAHRTIASHRRQ